MAINTVNLSDTQRYPKIAKGVKTKTVRVAFVHCVFESMGLEYLSSYLKKEGHDVRLFFDPMLFSNYLLKNKFLDKYFSYRTKVVASVAAYKPDIIAFSVSSTTFTWCCDTAEALKRELDIPIVFGGPHPTAVPKRVLKKDFVDFVVCG